MKGLKQETEKKIISAAHEVFIEKGLEGARMQEIADRAGINKALLHYYFRSKDKLFDAVFQDIISAMIPEFAKSFQSDLSIGNMMRTFIEFYNTIFKENPYLPQFFFHEIWQHPDKLADFIRSQDIRPNDIIEKIRNQLPDSGQIEFLPQHMIANVMGMCLFPHIARPLFQRMFFDNNEAKYSQFLDERTAFLIDLLSGMGNHSESRPPDENF